MLIYVSPKPMQAVTSTRGMGTRILVYLRRHKVHQWSPVQQVLLAHNFLLLKIQSEGWLSRLWRYTKNFISFSSHVYPPAQIVDTSLTLVDLYNANSAAELTVREIGYIAVSFGAWEVKKKRGAPFSNWQGQ